MQFMKHCHQRRPLWHKLQSETKSCNGEQQKPQDYPPAETDMKVVKKFPATLTCINSKPLAQLPAIMWQTNPQSANEDEDKEQRGVGNDNLST